ncbi:MAG: cytochrome P450, partial [Anaerolineales bacterium]|nr:cytochrome P450 [Anaerolineales bacterium]
PIQETMESWRRVANSGQVLDVALEMNHLALESGVRFLFGSGVRAQRDQVLGPFEVLNREVARRFKSLIVLPLWLPSPRNLASRRAIDQIDSVVKTLVERHQEADSRGTLLRALTEAHGGSQGGVQWDRRVRDEIVTLTLAGHETTAALLSWTWYLLALHPDAAKRVRQEVDHVIGGRAPSADDLERLTFTEQVLKEALRLYPPVWIISRRAKRSDQVSGYRIAADGVVAISPYATHRHPRYWERPDEFDPSRFEPGRERERDPFAYFPFGGGPRLCIGGGFALMEAKMVVAAVVQRFRLKLANRQPVQPEPLVTLRPAGGLPMEVRARQAPD